ncbi:MAG: hypothetical protein AVDCRST_MAG48-733, partial [uncultured Friedmanniella sp.]
EGAAPRRGLVRAGPARRPDRGLPDGRLPLRADRHPPLRRRPDPAQPAARPLRPADARAAPPPAAADAGDHDDALRRARARLPGGRGEPAAAARRRGGGRRVHLVDRHRDELRQGRPRPPGVRRRPLAAADRRGRPGPLAEPGRVAAGRVGAQVRPDRRCRHLLPLGADQDPQRRLEPDLLAEQLHPHLGDRPPPARPRPVPAALPGPAAGHAVVRLPGRADLPRRALAARPGPAVRRGLLARLPRVHGRRPLHPLRADAGLLAGLRPARTAAGLVGPATRGARGAIRPVGAGRGGRPRVVL